MIKKISYERERFWIVAKVLCFAVVVVNLSACGGGGGGGGGPAPDIIPPSAITDLSKVV